MRRLIRTFSAAVAAAAIVAFMISGLSTPAQSAERFAPSAEDDGKQPSLLAASEQVYQGIAESKAAGRLGANVSTLGGSVEIPWVGAVPRWLQDLVNRVASRTGASIKVVPAMHSESKLMQYADKVRSAIPQELWTQTIIEINRDSLTIVGPGLATQFKQRDVGRADSNLANLFTQTDTIRNLGVAVTLQDGNQTTVPAARLGDANNFRGGASYFSNSGHGGQLGCTTGFTAQQSNSLFILTAAHCSDYFDGQLVRSSSSGGGLGATMGVSDGILELQDQYPGYDLGLVRLDQNLFNLPEVYADPTFGTVTVRGLAGQGMPSGYTYCSSGNTTKYKCNLLSGSQSQVCYATAHGSECQFVIGVSSTNGGSAFCQGDSGGPIFYHPYGLGSPNVIAAGIISGISVTAPTQTCSTQGYASVVASAVNKFPGLQVRYVQ